MANARDIGCLLIDDPLCGVGALHATAAALSRHGARTDVFLWDKTGRLYPALQRAYQRIRRDDGVNAMIALGTGCDCALALSCQLPADRLVLIEPMQPQGSGDAVRQLRRVASFARRNAAFCVADALIVPGPNTDDDRLARLMRDLDGRATLLRSGEEMWSNRKEVLNLGIFHFLRDGVLPKSLAENPEMCIIYG